MHRRSFMRNIATLTASASLFHAKLADATWLAQHFSSSEFSTLFDQLFAGHTIIDSHEVNISLPEIAENGAVVPITISSSLDHIDKIYILVEKNPTPLACEFELSKDVVVYITARIKMAESCNVVVIAQQDDYLLRSQKWVNVMQGGCGTG